MGRRGQAAMEFLMTYGWAILAAVIVIGVLASFGVFSPSKYVPTSCVLSAPLGCDKSQVAASDATDAVSIVVRNGAGDSITLDSVTIENCGTEDNAGAGWTMGDGATQLVTITCTGGLIEGDKVNEDMNAMYTPSGGSLAMRSSGSVTVEVGA